MLSTISTSEAASASLNGLRTYFAGGATRPYEARRDALKALKRALKDQEEALLAAMHADMRKPRFEAYMADIGIVHAEIDGAFRTGE